MKKQRFLILCGVLVFSSVLLFSGCATVRGVPRKGAVENLMELINSGNTEMIVNITAIPMLVDGEMVNRDQEISSFWAQVNKAGFHVQTGKDIRIQPVDSDTYLLFGDTMEVKTFFSKYVPKTAVTAEIEGTGGKYVFLLSGRNGKYPYLFGFTGPVQ